MRSHSRLIVAFLIVAVIAACAFRSAKQQAVVIYAAADAALSQLQDSERAIYAAKTFPGLTPAVHATISDGFDRAFGLQIKAGQALKLWESGQPIPQDITDYFDEADRVIADLQKLLPNDARLALADHISRWARELVALAKRLRIQPPGNVAAVAGS